MEQENNLEKLNSLFKEELWGRIEPKDVGISKFKILDDLFNNLVSSDQINTTLEICTKHLQEHTDSITASYLVGNIGYHVSRIEDTIYLKKLIDLFMQHHKWAVTKILAEKILEYGENRVAIKALALSLERLGRNKEAIPVWESLLKIDRFDAEVSKKLALALIDDDPEKSLQYMKLSIEGFIKSKDFQEIPNLWNKLVSVAWEDLSFFERIERMLVDSRQFDLTASLLKSLLQKYRDKETPEQAIELLKKILLYTPDDNSSRRELIKLYNIKHGEHSQYDQFLNLSKLNNFKFPAKHAISDFEDYITFDKDNYAFHRSWGTGKIEDIDSERIIINFKEKLGHQMSIQMSLQSLVPLGHNHLYVMEYEDMETVQEMFKTEFTDFLELLINSYNGSITLADIKKELIPRYVSQKNWSKWWSKTRTEIKKNPNFGFTQKKPEVIYMRDKPITFAEELLNNFIKVTSFSEKLDIAMEFSNNLDLNEGAPVAQYFVDYFLGNLKKESPTKQVLSFFILKGFTKFIDAKKMKLKAIEEKIVGFIKESTELPEISLKIDSYDYKKDFVNLIKDSRNDWPEVISRLLFETPVRIHRYIINTLIREQAYSVINTFIVKTITDAKQNPEIFIWISKNILSKIWDYDWLEYSQEKLVLSHFRLMSDLKKIETKGNRLKNISLDILFDNEMIVLKDIINGSDLTYLGKIFDLFIGISYVDQSYFDKFYALIRENHPDFTVSAMSTDEEEWDDDSERLIVTQEGFEKMTEDLNRMVKVEMTDISKELAKVADVSGDMRENVEYTALMEKQTILKKSINKLEEQLKKVEILDPATISTDSVNIGTNVKFENKDTGEKSNYIILGPGVADYEKRILSYQSPIAKAMLGKKVGDEININFNEENMKFKILEIEKYDKIQL